MRCMAKKDAPVTALIPPVMVRQGPWRIEPKFRTVDGVFECVGVTITSDPPTRLTSTVYRGFALHRIISAARRLQAGIVRSGAVSIAAAKRDVDRFAAQLESREEPKRGRPSLGVEHYRQVAHVYLDALAQGRADPVSAVQQWWAVQPASGGEQASKTQASKWVWRARHEHGLLRDQVG